MNLPLIYLQLSDLCTKRVHLFLHVCGGPSKQIPLAHFFYQVLNLNVELLRLPGLPLLLRFPRVNSVLQELQLFLNWRYKKCYYLEGVILLSKWDHRFLFLFLLVVL
jgi:hypothetical protein